MSFHRLPGYRIEMCLTSLRGEGRFPSPGWEQSSREPMMVKRGQRDSHWGRETERGGRGEWEGGRGGDVITLSLVHCCLLSDLIWSRRHTWAKAHPSQVLQTPPCFCSFLCRHPSVPSSSPLCSPLFLFHSPLSQSLTACLSRSVVGVLSLHPTRSDSFAVCLSPSAVQYSYWHEEKKKKAFSTVCWL